MNKSKALDPTSAAFLFTEKRTTPMHIAVLGIYKIPKGSDEAKFLQRLVDTVGDIERFRFPFGSRLHSFLTGPSWIADDDIDISYHLRRSGLATPGDFEQLFTLVSRLHGTSLDRDKPLWEQHLINGLEGNRFAIYTKLHHAAIDGVGMAKLGQSMHSTRKSDRLKASPFCHGLQTEASKGASGEPAQPVSMPDLRVGLEVLKQAAGSTTNISSAMLKYLQGYVRPGDLTVPWQHSGPTPLNTKVGAPRSFNASSWELDRIRRLGKTLGGTINDVVLTVCSGAIRSYLKQWHELPTRPLTTIVPISLRDKGDTGSANQIAFITVNLATDVEDSEQRFRDIQRSVKSGKSLYSGLSATEAGVFSALTQAPVLTSSLLGLTPKYPHSSVLISNVPGPRKKMYIDGAELEASYPVAALPEGIALNITVSSYAGRLDCGAIACRRSLPEADRIIDLMEDALVDLEEVAGITT